jgi:hypothetical protein
MNFGDALETLKAGKKVARSGWNGKGMWLCLVPANQWGLGRKVPFDYGQVGNELRPWVGIKSVDNQFVPWQPSQTDMLAEDWEEVQ